ncbi:Cthe_2314 family HEPN domain-containing protein [Azohydromonas caseinilytica]|uniref:Cthe-2314-like HEPN domain-containing protein n=1 Tax=Azohydromonas caseinilytica TaxID=2728836 RepID=A0A848FDG2_9BURK|nr:Cthe_2314 family HEPN domain-containing protein [Azohydromonas caseinilytica]NML17036.1 hypothetical protein [Azohydromonas caseinilytica]
MRGKLAWPVGGSEGTFPRLPSRIDAIFTEKYMHKIETEILLDKESPLLSAETSNGGVHPKLKSDLDLYIISCAKALTTIISSTEKTKLSLSLLDVSHVELFSETGQSDEAYIEMLVENCIIRVQSIYDRTLIFVNRILDLGISNESISHNIMVTNEHVKKFKLDEKLKNINKACNGYRLIRNTVIHHGRHSEDQLDKLNLIISADRLSKEVGKGSFIKPEELRIIKKSYLETKREELGIYLGNIEEKLFQLYDSILPIYTYQKDKLRAR